MPSIMDWITYVTVALVISLILLGFKLNSMHKIKKARKKSEGRKESKAKKLVGNDKAEISQTVTPEKNYANIVRLTEEGLLKVKKPDVASEEFNSRLNKFKGFDYRKLSDDEIFWALTYVMFFNMGKKAAMIEKKLPLLKEHLFGFEKLAGLSDEELNRVIVHTGFDRQIRWCRDNAGTFKGLVDKFGSFKEYLAKVLDISDINCSNEHLTRFHKDLTMLFEGIGETSGWHFISEMGFFSLKPDKVIRRIFYRLGLIQEEEDMAGTLEAGRSMSAELALPIRYLDIVFAKYGQVGESDLLGTTGGICTENEPKCEICPLKVFCNYYSLRNAG